jgi:amino acid transporter
MVYEYTYMVIEYVIFTLYLIFIFLSVQIWFLWKDINKDELEFRGFASESFFRKNCIYVFSFSTFFIIGEFEFISEASGIFDMMALISILLFTYSWYSTLKPYAHRKTLPREFRPPKEYRLKDM